MTYPTFNYTITVSAIDDEPIIAFPDIKTFKEAFRTYVASLDTMSKSHGRMRRVVMHKNDQMFLDCKLGEQVQ